MAGEHPPLPFTAQLTLTQTSPTQWSTIHPPRQMGNPLNIAYGGYALATACKAACLSVPGGYHVYSMLGNYLGPAYCDRVLHARVRTLRQTRTFATRQVEVSQSTKAGDGDGGKEMDRICLIATIDFMVAEERVMLDYSKTPSKQYSHWKDCKSQAETFERLVDDGKVSQQMVDAHAKAFSVVRDLYDVRPCPEGVFAKNLFGYAKKAIHGQESLQPWQRTTADWFKAKEDMEKGIDHVVNLTFFIDSAVSFLPLSFGGLWFDDIGAVSSLDFSLRFFQNALSDVTTGDEDFEKADGIHVNRWLFREMYSSVASSGRSYGESWVWDERGRAVACMSQQSILRPPQPTKKGKL